jgi:hypothetical protein
MLNINLNRMTELEKLVQTWGKFKPTGTPHEHIWNGFIEDAKAAIEREKQALSLSAVVGQSEQLKAFVDWWHGLSQEELVWYEGRYVEVFLSL